MGAMKVGNGSDPDVTCGPHDQRRLGAEHRPAGPLSGRRGSDGCHRRAAPSTGRASSTSRPCSAASSTARPSPERRYSAPVAPISSFTGHRRHDRRRQRHRDGPHRLRLHPGSRQGVWQSASASRAGMIGLNRGAVSDPAAPFGGMKQSRPRPRRRQRGHLRNSAKPQYIAAEW